MWFLSAIVLSFTSISHALVQKGRFDSASPLVNWGNDDIESRGPVDHPAVIHFLFLVKGSLPHADLWRQFFEKAPRNSWRAWLHCADPIACEQNNVISELAQLQQVDTAASSYCTDLVSPSIELFRRALAAKSAGPGAIEKFVLVSDSTLPVKSFNVIYHTLTADDNSDLCIAPMKEWRWAHVDGQKVWLVKHSQWVILNREHAQTLVNEWIPPLKWDTFLGWWFVPLKGGPWANRLRRVLAYRFIGHPGGEWACTDEQAVFAKVFGALVPNSEGEQSFPKLGKIAHTGPQTKNAQGRCRTFVVFRDTESLGNLTHKILRAMQKDPARKTHIDGPSHPMALEHLGTPSLQALRESPFLFARKFVANKGLSMLGETSYLQLIKDDNVI